MKKTCAFLLTLTSLFCAISPLMAQDLSVFSKEEQRQYFWEMVKQEEKSLARVGVRFEKDQLDLAYLESQRRKNPSEWNPKKTELMVSRYLWTLRQLLSTFQQEMSREEVASYQQRLRPFEEDPQVWPMIWKNTEGFMNFCMGTSADEKAVKLAQYLQKSLQAPHCEGALELLTAQTELVLVESEMEGPLTSLRALKAAKNLERLEIHGQNKDQQEGGDHIDSETLDLSPLHGLTHLKVLKINRIPLANPNWGAMKKLKTLHVQKAGLTAVASMASLKGLKDLNLDTNQVSDLSVLMDLKLTVFSAKENPIAVCPKEGNHQVLIDFCRRR